MTDIDLLADEPLAHKLIKKGSWLYFFMIITAPVAYFVRVIISNKLWVDDVGLFYSILWFIWLLSIYHDLGMTEALQYFLPKYRIEKKYGRFKSVIILTLIAQVTIWWLIALMIYFGADRLALHHFNSPEAGHIIKILCRYFIGINFFTVFNSIYVAFQDAISSSLIEFFRAYGILTFTLIFRFANILSTTTFTIAWLSWLWIALIASSIIFFKKYRHTLKLGSLTFEKTLIKTQLKYAFRIFLGANVGTLLGQIDQQLIVNFLWPLQAWYYSNFFSLVGMYTIIMLPILSLVFPIVTELITKKHHEKLAMFQSILYKYFSVFALSIGWLFFAFGPEIASVLFGTKFTYSGQLLAYIWPFLIFNVLTSINYWILAWFGKVKQRVIVIWWALLVNVLANVIFILGLGWWLMWAVASLILGRLILWILSFRIINTHQAIDFEWKFLRKNLLIIWAISIAYYFLKSHFLILSNGYRFQNIWYLAIAVVVYYWIIASTNLWSIKWLLREIKIIRKG